MLTVLSITSAIFIIITIGFITVRRGVLAASSARGLGVFVVDYALPALLFKALAQHPMGQVISIDFFMAYALGSVSLLVLGVLFRCVIQRRGVQEAAILTMGITVSNSAFMGFPIAQQIFGETARANLAVYVSVENLVMLPVLITLAEVGNQSHARGILIVQTIIKRLL
ncbi:MAG TPA: permease, partial [Methylococcaceae bacterium]|nr:permease [Methylococcaceae bacterium]